MVLQITFKLTTFPMFFRSQVGVVFWYRLNGLLAFDFSQHGGGAGRHVVCGEKFQKANED
jgi:hypothetical protein